MGEKKQKNPKKNNSAITGHTMNWLTDNKLTWHLENVTVNDGVCVNKQRAMQTTYTEEGD